MNSFQLPLDQAKSPKTRQHELNRIIFNFTSLPETTVRKSKTLRWLKALMNKLYDYSYGLFQKSDDSILDESYSVSLILYSIMDTKFVFKSITDLNWFDMISATKRYRSRDWEVDLFCRFVTGEYTLKCFFWFVCSRALLMLKKKKVINKERKEAQKKRIKEDINRILPAIDEDEEDEDFEMSLENSSEERLISLEKVVKVLIGLANKDLIHTNDFNDDKGVRGINLFLMKKFESCIYQNERGQYVMSFSTFLGYLINIKTEGSVEKLFEELKLYLDSHDFSPNISQNISVNTSIDNNEIIEKVHKGKKTKDQNTSPIYLNNSIDAEIETYYDRLRQEEEELDVQRKNSPDNRLRKYAPNTYQSPVREGSNFEESTLDNVEGTLSIRILTERVHKGCKNQQESNELLQNIQDFVNQALNKLRKTLLSNESVAMEDQLMFLQLETFLNQASHRSEFSEYWITRIKDMKRKLSDQIQNIQTDYVQYKNELLGTDDSSKETMAYQTEKNRGYQNSEQDRERGIMFNLSQRLELVQQINEVKDKTRHTESNDSRLEPESGIQETDEDNDSLYSNEKDVQRSEGKETDSVSFNTYHNDYSGLVLDPNLEFHLQQLQELEQLQHRYSENQLKQIENLLKHQEELLELQKRRISGGYTEVEARFQEKNIDLLGNVSPVKLSPNRRPVVDREVQVKEEIDNREENNEENQKLNADLQSNNSNHDEEAHEEQEYEEEQHDYYTNWRSILENANWKAELIELVTLSRAEFEKEQKL